MRDSVRNECEEDAPRRSVGAQLLAQARRRAGIRGRRGMSLVEVMVVIAIILTLMSILAIGVFSVFGESQVQTTVLTMGKVNERIQLYMLRKKKPPQPGEGLTAAFNGENVPTDAWGNEFVYVTPGPNGQPYDIISLGSDGQEGGSGNAADIVWSDQQ